MGLEDFPKVVAMEPNWQLISGASPAAQFFCSSMLCKLEMHRPSAQEMLRDKWLMSIGQAAKPALGWGTMQGLMNVKQRSQFEKFVGRLVATQLDAGQQKKVNEAFRAFDQDKDGKLTRGELHKGLVMLGARPEEAAKVVDELDVGKTGYVSYTEFLAGVTDLQRKSPKERDELLWLAWQQFSPDSHGLVRTGDIQAALAAR